MSVMLQSIWKVQEPLVLLFISRTCWLQVDGLKVWGLTKVRMAYPSGSSIFNKVHLKNFLSVFHWPCSFHCWSLACDLTRTSWSMRQVRLEQTLISLPLYQRV